MGNILRLVDTERDGQADEYTVFASDRQPARRGVRRPDALRLASAVRHGVPRCRRRRHRRRSADAGAGPGLRPRFPRRRPHDQRHGDRASTAGSTSPSATTASSRPRAPTASEIQMRGGGNVRVRPDGSGLEIYSRGTRNNYDVAIDPYLNLFARGNTNDGGGWDIRLNHFVAGANVRLPGAVPQFRRRGHAAARRLRRRLGHRHAVRRRPGLPAGYGDALYSVDWGTQHHLPPPADAERLDVHGRAGAVPDGAAADGHGRRRRLAALRWPAGAAGSSAMPARRRLRRAADAAGAKPSPPCPILARLMMRGWSDWSARRTWCHRRFAQQEMLRRGRTAERIGLLEKRVRRADRWPAASRRSSR